jgi:hypothetical protein
MDDASFALGRVKVALGRVKELERRNDMNLYDMAKVMVLEVTTCTHIWWIEHSVTMNAHYSLHQATEELPLK